MENKKPNSPETDLVEKENATAAVDTPQEAHHSENIEEKTESESVSEVSSAAAPKVKDNQSSSANEQNKTHIGVKLSLFFIALIAIGVSGFSAWLYFSLNAQQQASNQIETQLNSQTGRLDSTASQFNQSLSQTSQRIAELEVLQRSDTQAYQELQQLKSTTEELSQRVSVVARRSPNHWMASEAEYLVRMAGRKLWLEKDPLTATGLLEAADERIKSMRDPALMPIRQALANDIKQTKSVKSTDVVGTVYAIDALISQLDTLPLNRAKAQAGEDVVQQPITDSISDWQSNLAKTWQEMTETFITVRKRTTDLEPLLAPEQQWYLVENIRNKLLQAQLALYNYDEVNYRQSISFANKWITQYFDLEATETQASLDTLQALSTLKIERISQHKFQSTKLLQQLITYGELMPMEEPEL
ncbi:uroporphyrinogen-III C-methyltransferase [Shewanella maritima]|uniref:uroporphyrinogen-III C-methyltransferase n=1 Tax=Shewanella maritima TaxID=2520507 RepID=UPI00373512FF